jgi:hypothetical protein
MNKDPDSTLPFTGRFYDGLGNKITMLAYANPGPDNYNAAGYGLVRFRKSTREIILESWPRHVDVTQPGSKPFPGWPIRIHQEDNYGRAALAHLPKLQIEGVQDPVIQVIDDALGEIVYSIRIKGSAWQPRVFKEGRYTIKVRHGAAVRTFSGVSAVRETADQTLRVVFR